MGGRSRRRGSSTATSIPATHDANDEAAGTLDDGNVRREMRKVLAALPLDFPKSFTPHSGRHTFASQLLAEGKDLQYVRAQLGHESIKLTADTYGSWLPSNRKNTNDCLDDPEWTEASHHAG
jgi:integrase